MISGITLVTPTLYSRPLFSTARPPLGIAETTTPRVEIPPVTPISSQLIPAPHRDAVISAALGSQTLFIRGLANGDRRSLNDFGNEDQAPSPTNSCLAA
jgi:hypothetical protein